MGLDVRLENNLGSNVPPVTRMTFPERSGISFSGSYAFPNGQTMLLEGRGSLCYLRVQTTQCSRREL